MTTTPIMQFGTSRFLQAHADLFLSEARAAGQAVGPVTVVQTSGDSGRARRLAALATPFPVRIEGLLEGRPHRRQVRVDSIARALSTATDWPEVTRVFCDEVQIVLSNTGDAGYGPQPADRTARGRADGFDQAMSFPAKLTELLRRRFAGGGAPLQVMPLELIPDNGRVLRDRVLALAAEDPAPFRRYLTERVTWVSSLVDRIVSQPLEPAGAVAEPYALWAIEDQPGLIRPCHHPAIEVLPTLAEIEALKLFVLNLGHTVLADRWLGGTGGRDALVREAVTEAATLAHLQAVWQDEVRPAFAAAGRARAFETYRATTLDRFANPFLDHRLSDIAQNHREKVTRRIGGLLHYAERHGDTAPKPVLTALMAHPQEARP